MSRTPVTAMSLAALLTLSLGSVSLAQLDEPAATAPPLRIDGITLTVLTNQLSDTAVNSAVTDIASFAFTEVGGKLEGKKAGFVAATLPTTTDLVAAISTVAESKPNLLLTSGGDSQATVGLVAAHPETMFMDIDQPIPCVTGDGQADPSGTCAGGMEALPPNYVIVEFESDQGAYLAGLVAAAASREDRIGIISGLADCRDCNRYIQGFLLGARSLKPDIEVELAYLADEGEEAAFGDPVAARTFAQAFIDVYEPDVLLPLAGSASAGIIEAACDADILAIGVDIDVSTVHPDLSGCIAASVVKDYEYAVKETIFSYANGGLTSASQLGLADGRVAVTDEWTRLPGLPVDLSERYAAAEAAIRAGQVQTCPSECGAPVDPAALPAAPVDEGGAADAEASPSAVPEG